VLRARTDQRETLNSRPHSCHTRLRYDTQLSPITFSTRAEGHRRRSKAAVRLGACSIFSKPLGFSGAERTARAPAVARGELETQAPGRGSLAGPSHPAGDRAKKAVRPRHRRELGRWTQTVFALSTRRVSGLMMINRSTMNYRSRRDPQHALRVRMRELAASRVRFGYRRLTVMLRREGWAVNAKRIYRLYTEDGRKRERNPIAPTAAGHVLVHYHLR
jgi:HTH-like domain